jgi:hypothetical protein
MARRHFNLKSLIFMISLLLWGQLVAAAHQHDLDTPDDQGCDICLMVQHGKTGLADTIPILPVPSFTDVPASTYQVSLITRLAPRPSSRAPPQFSV